MEKNFNLPDGVSLNDICGKPMPLCENCGEEHNESDELCQDCREKISAEQQQAD